MKSCGLVLYIGFEQNANRVFLNRMDKLMKLNVEKISQIEKIGG